MGKLRRIIPLQSRGVCKKRHGTTWMEQEDMAYAVEDSKLEAAENNRLYIRKHLIKDTEPPIGRIRATTAPWSFGVSGSHFKVCD